MTAVSAQERPVRPSAARHPLAEALTGTRELAKLAYRRDKLLLPIWVYLIFIGTVANAFEMKAFYKTAAAREALAASGRGNPAFMFLYGQLNGTSVGALAVWHYGVWASLFAGLMSIFTVVRHTRANEESGRQELVGSARVGRQAPLAAAMLMAAGANIVAAVLLCAVLPLVGLPVAGSAAFALAIGACGLAFTGITGVAAQLTSGSRAARGLGFAGLGLSFLLRSVGDASGGGTAWLTWLGPLGWTEEVRAFAGERWWVLLLPLALFAVGTWAAFALAARRDLGAGLLSERPGRSSASAALRGPFSLAWRLQRTTLFWWAVGFAFVFGPSGSIGSSVSSVLGGSAAMKKEFTQLGGQSELVDAYLAALMMIGGVFAAAYAVSAVLRLRSEETGTLAEPVLAGTAGRLRWGLSHLVIALVGSALLLVVGGVTAGLGYALSGSGVPVSSEVGRLAVAGLGQLPSVLVIAAVAVAAFGLFPRAAVAVGWTAFGATLFLSLFGQVFRLSHWIMDISPFTHAPHLPGGSVTAEPLLLLSLIAVLLAAAGLAGLRRRDIGLAVAAFAGLVGVDVVDADRDRDDQGVADARRDLHPVGVADAEPVPGHLADDLVIGADQLPVLVGEAAQGLQALPVGQVDFVAMADRREEGGLDLGDHVTARVLDRHRVPHRHQALVHAGQQVAAGVPEFARLAQAQGLPVHEERPVPVLVLDPEVGSDGEHAFTHEIAHGTESTAPIRRNKAGAGWVASGAPGGGTHYLGFQCEGPYQDDMSVFSGIYPVF